MPVGKSDRPSVPARAAPARRCAGDDGRQPWAEQLIVAPLAAGDPDQGERVDPAALQGRANRFLWTQCLQKVIFLWLGQMGSESRARKVPTRDFVEFDRLGGQQIK